MQKTAVIELPWASTSLLEEPILKFEGSDLVLKLAFDVSSGVSLAFRKTRAMRYRSEVYCAKWHIEDAYDVVSEVHQSHWIEELAKDASPGSEGWVMRHFILTIDSWGCLEVVAEDVEHLEASR